MPRDNARTVLVVGAGPVGRLVVLDFLLRKVKPGGKSEGATSDVGAGAMRVLWYVRNDSHRSELLQHGLRAETAGSDVVDVTKFDLGGGLPVEICDSTRLKEMIKCGVAAVIACVKAYALEGLLKELAALGLKCPILSISNGICETGLHFLGILFGGARIADGRLVYTPGQRLAWGIPLPEAIQSPPDALTDFFSGDGLIDAVFSAGIHKTMLEKLVVNAVINPLTALFVSPNEIITLKALHPLVSGITREAGQAICATYPHYCFDPEALGAKVLEVARDTVNNLSSMLVDVRAGRETEIAFMNGKIVEMAESKGLQAPLNRMLCELIPLLAHAIKATSGK